MKIACFEIVDSLNAKLASTANQNDQNVLGPNYEAKGIFQSQLLQSPLPANELLNIPDSISAYEFEDWKVGILMRCFPTHGKKVRSERVPKV